MITEVSHTNSTHRQAGDLEVALAEEPFQDSVRHLTHALQSQGLQDETAGTGRQADQAPVTKPTSR